MLTIVAYIIAFTVTYPIGMTMLAYFILSYFFTNRKIIIHKSMEYTAVFYLISTLLILNETFQINIVGPVSICLLVVFLLFILIQWKLIHDIKIKRILKLYLRGLFLLFFFARIGLTISSIFLQLNN